MPLKLYLRGNIWWYKGSVAKRRLRGSTGIPKKQKALAARKVAKIELDEYKCSVDGPQAVLTFAQAALAYRAAGKSGRFLDKVEDYFKDMLVKDITSGKIREMAMELFPTNSNASKNRRAITPARSVINYAADSNLCNPIRVKLFKPRTKEKPYATLEWIQAFAKEASAELVAWALLMFLTGARPTEGLECDIDLPGGTVLLHESKIGHERRAHLPAMLIPVLANLEATPGRPTFFYRTLEDLRPAWNSAVKRAKIKRMTPHCCRHGFITGLLRGGVDVKTAAKLADMSAVTLLNTYAHAIQDITITDLLTGT